MAKKIVELSELPEQPAVGDLIIIEDVSASTTKKITWDNFLADGSVTPDKRSGGFFIGTIAKETLGTTGNKAITGVGFTPKLVRFTIITGTSGTASSLTGFGAMDENGNQFYQANYIASASEIRRIGTTNACIHWTNNNASQLSAAFVSMDADGFTVNVTNSNSTFDVAYEAYG